MSPVSKVILIIGFIGTVLAQQTDVKFCLDNVLAQKKCLEMASLVVVDDDVKVHCILDALCEDAVINGNADVVIVDADNHANALKNLEPVLFEKFDDSNVMVAVVKADQESNINTLPLKFDDKDLRHFHSALFINHNREYGVCNIVKAAPGVEVIKIMRYHEMEASDKTGMNLVCVKDNKLVVKAVNEYKDCHVEANIPNAVMIKKNSDKKERVIKILMTASLTKFYDFKLFGKFENTNNVMFSNEATGFVEKNSEPNGITVEKFVGLHCKSSTNNH